jgi:hypothetical protein
MNTKSRLAVAILALICFAALPTNAVAQNAPANPAALVATLQQAYVTLGEADHDYHGHRDAAMKDIAAAALLLGTDITGNGHGGETQALSDLQLRSVQMSLLSVGRAAPPGANHNQIVGHINGAIRQISMALASESPQAGGPSGGTGGAPAGGPENVIANNTIEIASLERIYQILTMGNHDYKGHRVRAMRAIARATKALGGNISGDGHTKENQSASDALLHQAQTLLEQVANSFSTSDPKNVSKDLNEAVQQLSTALSIK